MSGTRGAQSGRGKVACVNALGEEGLLLGGGAEGGTFGARDYKLHRGMLIHSRLPVCHV